MAGSISVWPKGWPLESIPETEASAKTQIIQQEVNVDQGEIAFHDSIKQLRGDIAMLRQEQEFTADALGSLTMGIAEKCASACRQMETSIRLELQQFKKRMMSDICDNHQTLKCQLVLDLVQSFEVVSASVQEPCETLKTNSTQVIKGDIAAALSATDGQAAINAMTSCQCHGSRKMLDDLQRLADSIQQSFQQYPLLMHASKTRADTTHGKGLIASHHSAPAACGEDSQQGAPRLQAYHSPALFKDSGQAESLQLWCCPGEGPPPPAFKFNRERPCRSGSECPPKKHAFSKAACQIGKHASALCSTGVPSTDDSQAHMK